MSFDQLSSLEAGRHGDGGGYSDDPGYKQLLHELRTKLSDLERNILKLRTDVNLLGTRRDTARVRERVHDFLEKSRQACMEIGEGIKKLQTWDDLSKQQKYERNKISTEFQDAFKEFQDLQRIALEKQRASVSAARAAHDSEAGADEGYAGTLEQQQQQELSSLAAQDEVDFQEALIIEREEEIRNIEQGVGDLNVLFRQVAQIVSEQGEQLNTIADNVEVTRDDTRGAMVELTQASRYQKAARNKSCCLLIILAVILTIVLLAIFLD
ncbi:hypothetical protein jhhlp_002164 [Lomentospora prolificans]|uniref:t-SNARE coiled-coil homology domain-containing protein n=1 Tax=Lomentospora prolificans TaxID=41688 RepID=A0A2N3NDB6_9PEZI|nr:hypothetical protein jhhlp_002164 [Lomentospora prolificans]